MGACLAVFHVSVFMPVDVMQIYCSLSSVMHSAHCKHKFYKFYSTYPLEQKTTVEKSVLRIAASLMIGRTRLIRSDITFEKCNMHSAILYQRCPPCPLLEVVPVLVPALSSAPIAFPIPQVPNCDPLMTYDECKCKHTR
jgi:hypothetical protein